MDKDMTLEEAVEFFTIHQVELSFRKMDGINFDPHVLVYFAFKSYRYPDLITAAKETYKRYHRKDWTRGDTCFCKETYVVQ